MFKPDMMSGSIYAAQFDILTAGSIPKSTVFPIYAENQAMVESWVKELNNYIFEYEDGNYSLSHYDKEYNMYWINTPTNTHISTYFRFGFGCQDMLRQQQKEGKTTWQFPFLWPNTPTAESLPMPEQEQIMDVYLYFNDWIEEERKLQIFLDKINERYAEYFEVGQYVKLNNYTAEEKYSLTWGKYTNMKVEVGHYNLNLGMLFEIGVMLCYAYNTNLWNITDGLFYSSLPIASTDDLKGATKMINAYEKEDNASFRKAELIEYYAKKIKKYTVTAPIENKIAALAALTQSRPLLAREQLQLKILQSILDAKDEATINTILTEIAQTPTDAELRKILITQAQSKRNLILDNNF